MRELVVAGCEEIGDRYLCARIREAHRVKRPEMLPAVRLLRMLRWPDQRAILWPDVPNENDPLPGGAAARLRVYRPAGEGERARLILDCDWAASLRRCGLEALRAARSAREREIIALQLAGRRCGRRSTMILDEYGREAVDLRLDKAFEVTANRLRNRAQARAEADRILAEAVSDAVSLTAPMSREGSRGKGTPSDPTARGADRILKARERVAEIEAWERVFQKTENDYPPGTPEHKAAEFYYECGWTLAQIGEMMHYEKQTVRKKRNDFVIHAAFYASEAGLLGGDAE